MLLGAKSSFDLGSSPFADVSLIDPEVAGVHVKVLREGTGWVACDVSGRGFDLNGRHVADRAAIAPGDTLRLGGHAIRLLDDATAAPPPAFPPPTPAVAPGTGAALVAVQGNDAGKTFPLGQKPAMILGRGVATDITIWDIRASRAHCRVDRDAEGYTLTDLSSSNGTYVNDRKIATHRLRAGDRVRIGSTVMQFVGA